MEQRRAADVVGWLWVMGALAAAPWLGQGGSPCPPVIEHGQACILLLLPPDPSLGLLAMVGGAALLASRTGRNLLLSAGVLAGTGALAGLWAATHQFLGSAWHVPRLPVVLLCGLPPLLVAVQRWSWARQRPPTRSASPPAPGRTA